MQVMRGIRGQVLVRLRFFFWKIFSPLVFSRALKIESFTPHKARGHFYTISARPVFGAEGPAVNLSPITSRVAIVVQGAIQNRHNFTAQSLLSYSRIFPEARIILSTWKDSGSETLKLLRRHGITVLESSPPSNPGFANTNFQMVSTRKGIEVADEMGAEYVLKTRTDQRIYNPLALHYLLDLIHSFPLSGNQSLRQANRIVFTSSGSLLFRLYGMSDLLMFSHINDALNYWSGKLDPKFEIAPAKSLRQFAMQRPPEVWFCTRWLEESGEELEWTLSQYWKFVAERFVTVDTSTLDVYWPKYTSKENVWRTYRADNVYEEISHSLWRAISKGELVPDESILDLPVFDGAG